MSDEARDRAVYIDFIKSCFRYYPEAFAYYDRLVDHLSSRSKRPQSTLQTVELFEIAPLAESLSYPKAFPFEVRGWLDAQRFPRIAVLSGFPSPECIAFLGAHWFIRPEFFIANLTLTGKHGPKGGSYELPTLPSLRDNLVRVQLVSPLRSLVDKPRINSISRQRSDIDKACSRYEKGLSSDGRYGATRYRKVNLHDCQISSIEQAVSMTVTQYGDKWHAIFLADQGRSVMVQEGLPWSGIDHNGRPVGTITLVPYNLPGNRVGSPPAPRNGPPRPPEIASQQLQSISPPASGTGSQELPITLDQFHPLKRVVIADATDLSLLKSDPFFLLASLLQTSLLSWGQLLNVLKEIIKEWQDTLELSQDELLYDLEQLRYHIGIIHRTKEQVSETLDVVKQGGCTSWPKPTSPAQEDRKKLIQQRLQSDCLNLMERCSFMIAECESATTVLVGFAQLTASERGMIQAKEVHSLTKLATLFLPLSLTATIYGMNIREWQPGLTLWWFLGTGIVLLCLTFIYLYKQRWINASRGLWQRKTEHKSK